MDQIDYTRPDVWEYIATLLEHIQVPPLPRACGRVRCEPGWQWQPRLNDYDIWFVAQGHGVLSIAGHSYALQPGDLFLLRPGDTGWATQQPDDRLTVVYLHLDIIPPTTTNPWLPSRHVSFRETATIEHLLTRAVRLIESEDRLATVEARFVVHQCLAVIYRQDAANHNLHAAQHDSRIEHVIAHLRSQPERRVQLDEAAALVGLAPAYLSRLFSQATGESFRTFALRVRLQRARVLLEETSMSIGTIAQALGYDEIYLFSRQFKQHYGMSPRQIRDR